MNNHLLTCSISFGFLFFASHLSHGQTYTLKEKKVILSPYTFESVELNKEFNFFVCKGSSVRVASSQRSLQVTLDKTVINAVYLDDKYLGEQFAFHFEASVEKEKKTFVLTLNAPNEMNLSEVEDNNSSIVMDYKISLIDVYFNIGKNVIRMKISKL